MKKNLRNAYEASATVFDELIEAGHEANRVQFILVSQLTRRAAELAHDIQTLADAVENDGKEN